MTTMITETIESRELELYIDNTEHLHSAIVKLVTGKWSKGVFDLDKGIKGAMYTVNRGAKEYCREFGCFNDSWNKMFTMKDRELCAESLVRGIIEECKIGNY